MIAKNFPNIQLPTKIKSILKNLYIFKDLWNASITKFTYYSHGYIFQLIFSYSKKLKLISTTLKQKAVDIS